MSSEEQKVLRDTVAAKKAELDVIKNSIDKLKQNIPAEDPKFNDLRKRKAELTLELDDIEYQLQSGKTAMMNEQLETFKHVEAELIVMIEHLEQEISKLQAK